MIDVDQYDRIRFLHAVEGMSQRAIARTLGISRNTVKKYLDGEVIPGNRKPQMRNRNRSWAGVSIDRFIDILHRYLVWYNGTRIKMSLGAKSPLQYRRSLGLAA